MYYDISWYGTRMIAWGAMPSDPDAGPDWAAIWEEHIAGNEPYLLKWLRHQVDGPYWRNGSVGDGRRDPLPDVPDRRLGRRLHEPAAAPLPDADCPKKVLIGPWNHALPDAAIPGPRIDYVREMVRWLDHWNRGIDNGIMDEPPVQRVRPALAAAGRGPDRLGAASGAPR